jgi:general secretion pathway protein A
VRADGTRAGRVERPAGFVYTPVGLAGEARRVGNGAGRRKGVAVYEEFFGLSDAPFRLTPDPRFLYLSSKHAEALAHLRLGLTEPGGFVCITGEIGTGKTTVLRSFLADLGPDVATAFIFNPTLSWEDLLQRIVRELGVPTGGESRVDAMDALNTHLLGLRREGRIAVVVIDEAQAMPLEVLERLRLLSNLETSTEKLLRLVLVGQPQLARLLLDPSLAQLNQRITLRWHLRALTRTETFTYVRHRLAVAGGPEASQIFTTSALSRVHRYASGVPRLVNMIAHRATLAAYVQRSRRVTAKAVRRAYREIRAVPLHTASSPWRLGWVVGAVAGCVGLAIGLPRLGSLPGVTFAPATGAATAAPTAAPAAAPAPAASAAAAMDAELEQTLAGLEPDASLRSAVVAILAAWRVRELETHEESAPDALETIAQRRGLQDLRLTGNLSMLRLLNLPAVLDIRPPGVDETSYVALTAIDDADVTLDVGGRPIRVAPAVLDQIWFGEAHVLWRDFESLGPTFGLEAEGAHVARLQRLLTKAGLYSGSDSGTFDEATETAVLGFQRSRRLDPDSRVGRLTRIALYGAAGDYQFPMLAVGRDRQTAARDAGGAS